jgi:N-acetylated-alpha-linked acidic dipeptidase
MGRHDAWARGTFSSPGKSDFAAQTKCTTRLSLKPDFLADVTKVGQVNKKLRDMQRMFVREVGLHGRPFYKNALYAPNMENRYKAQMLPESMEASREGNLAECREWNV